jgi:uncharacterized OsmC-like protein
LAAVAAHKGIRFEKIEVYTSMELALATGGNTRTAFKSRIVIEGQLTPRERAILLNSAQHCDVHKVIRGEVTLDNELLVSDAP